MLPFIVLSNFSSTADTFYSYFYITIRALNSALVKAVTYIMEGERSGWEMGTKHNELTLFLPEGVDAIRITGELSRNSKVESVLHWAVMHGHEEVVIITLEKWMDLK